MFILGPWGRTQTNAYLVRDGSSWILVDAGWGSGALRIQAAVRSLPGSDTVLVAILLTHAHPDHAGAARELAEAWGCPVCVHQVELPWAGILCQRQGPSGPPWYTTWDRQAAIVSISAVAGLEPSVLATGHGLPLAGPGTAAAVRAFAERAGAR